MTTPRQMRIEKKRTALRTNAEGRLRALQLIETMRGTESADIAFVDQCSGSAMSAEEAMEGRVKWANKAGYVVLTREVPERFAPFNAVIRVVGTEDFRTDYLAMLFAEGDDHDEPH